MSNDDRSGVNSSRVNYEDNWQPLDPYADDGPSEMSWGDGLVPRGLENAPPSAGGMYKGQSPPSKGHISVSRR
jgi:hypothetical protein